MLYFFSPPKFSKKFKTLIGFVFGIVIVFAAYLFAQAITPGTVTVPPQDITQDVELRKPLDCKVVSANTRADCDVLGAGYQLTGGGGACNENDSDEPDFYPEWADNRFYANCGGSGDEVAYAVCCKFVQ